MSNDTSYSGIIVEQRKGDQRRIVKYNTANDERGRRDYYSDLDANKNSKVIEIGKSENKSKWNIRKYKDDVETTSTDDFNKHSYKSVLSDFDIDAEKVFKSSSSSPVTSPTAPKKKTTVKKKPSKKPSKKKSKKGGAKKKPSKKKPSKKKPSKKKKSKKKKSKKKAKKKR
jgi:hypothetical protein